VDQNRWVGIRETTYRRRYALGRMTTSARQLPADPVSSLVGRDEAVARVLASVQPPYVDALAVLIEGPAGIGKTSLLRAGVAKAEAAGATVLYARPVETEANYAYASLGDLLGPDLGSLGRLAEVHRAVLRRALGTDDVPESADALVEEAPDAQRVAIAVLAAFRALAAGGALLIAIDDAPWADPASRDALAFTMRRLAGLPVRLMIAQRSDMPGEPPPFGLADAARPIPIERLWLEPLSMGALHQLLRSATDSSFTRPTLLRIQELSGGNPFYALELARAFVASGTAVRPGQNLPMPSSLRELVGAHLDRVPASTRRLLLTVALSTKPTMGLLEAMSGPGTRTLLEPAIDAGLICVDGPTVTFDHPLYASTLVAAAPADDVRAVHAVLGRIAAEDPEARARHLALASEGPDAGVARSLARASARARGRGAPAMAGELADMAVERTPPAGRERSDRALAAAEAWFAAGDLPATRERAAALMPFLRGSLRARALLLMGLCAWYTGPAQEAVAELLPALSSARNDRPLLGLLHFYLAVFRDFDIAEARNHSALGSEVARGHARPRSPGGGVAADLPLDRHCLGRRPPMALLARGLDVETEGPLTDRLTSPGMWWAGIGRLDLARAAVPTHARFRPDRRPILERRESADAAGRGRTVVRRLAGGAAACRWGGGGQPRDGRRRVRDGAAGAGARRRLRGVPRACPGRGHRRDRADGTGRKRCVAAAWLQVTALVAASRGDAAAVEEATGRAWRHLAAGRLCGADAAGSVPRAHRSAWRSWADLTRLAWSLPGSKPATVEWPNHGPRQPLREVGPGLPSPTATLRRQSRPLPWWRSARRPDGAASMLLG
jgi:hypothetical protein